MDSKFGLTRNVIRPHYALITPDGLVPGNLPGWEATVVHTIVSGAMGAGLVQMLLILGSAGRGKVETGADEWFLYLLSGSARVDGTALEAEGYVWIPPDESFQFESTSGETRVLVFRKAYEPLQGHPPGPRWIGSAPAVPAVPFLQDPHARLQELLPGDLRADMAVNLFSFDPGATLPFVETHVMEHGMMFLEGSGVYRLGEDWHPVRTGDCLWIAPYCPQWFIAAGPGPARYIYYKDINRSPA